MFSGLLKAFLRCAVVVWPREAFRGFWRGFREGTSPADLYRRVKSSLPDCCVDQHH